MVRRREEFEKDARQKEVSAPTTEAQMEPETRTGEVTGAAFVNLRATPEGRSGKVVAVMRRFDKVEILKEDVRGSGGVTYLKIRHNGKSVGYVPTSHIFKGD